MGSDPITNFLHRLLSIPPTRQDGQLPRSSYARKRFLCVRPFILDVELEKLNASTS